MGISSRLAHCLCASKWLGRKTTGFKSVCVDEKVNVLVTFSIGVLLANLFQTLTNL